MRSYAIDILFDSAYYTGDTEDIETTEALHATDRAQFIEAIKKEIHSLISETRTLQPLNQDCNRPRREPGTTASVEDQNNTEM